MFTLLRRTLTAWRAERRGTPSPPPIDHDLLNVMVHRRAAVRMRCALSPLGGLPKGTGGRA